MSMLRRTILQGALAGLAVGPWHDARASSVITYPRPELNDHAWRFKHLGHYPIRLLEAALEKAGQRFVARPASLMMTQSRGLLELQARRGIDVMWTMTSPQREAELRPIRIPIYRGLIGWRLLMVRAKDLGRFAGVRRAEDLREVEFLQGHDWPDTEILRANGLRVQTSSDYPSMFKMLASGRAQAFPRSVIEIWNELDANRELGLVAEPNLVLVYPAAFYYFVNKDNEALAQAIERGLRAMQADGSFERLFGEFHGALMQEAQLARRRMIVLHNPLLPAATPLQQRELWFRR